VANDYERQSSVTAVLKKLEWPSLEQRRQNRMPEITPWRLTPPDCNVSSWCRPTR